MAWTETQSCFNSLKVNEGEEKYRRGGGGGLQWGALNLLLLLLLLMWGDPENFTALKIPRQCPLVLLIKVGK
jgi:hypothetical protein